MNTVRTSTKKTENIREYQTEATEMKNTTALKNIPEDFHNRLDEAEEKMRELEGREMELIQSNHQKEKRMKKKTHLRDLWKNIKWANIHIIGVPEKERKG